jgi:hypothetical protein
MRSVMNHAAAIVIAALLSACVRHEYVNELHVPGLCPPEEDRRIARDRQPPIIYERIAASPSDSLRGRVVESDITGHEMTDRPVLAAVVALQGTRQSVLTDSAGHFAIAVPSEGPFVLNVRRVGSMPRAETFPGPLSPDSSVVIALRTVVMDGPCSGLVAVPVRKPWWKWW